MQDGKLVFNFELNDGIANTAPGLTTADTMNYKYGYLEAKVKIPFGKGLSANMWAFSFYHNSRMGGMLTGTNYGAMAEIDIFETLGQEKLIPNIHEWYYGGLYNVNMNNDIHGTWRDNIIGNNKPVGYQPPYSITDTDSYYIIGYERTPEYIRMYVNGFKYAEYDLSVDFESKKIMLLIRQLV